MPLTQVQVGMGGNSNAPAFRAFANTTQTLTSAVDTRIALTNEIFDTASCFNNTASTVGGIPAYSFLPNVAGYYQINANIGVASSSTLSYNYIQIRKNGVNDIFSIYGPYGGTSQYGTASAVIFLNGTTDYVDLFVQVSGTGTLFTYSGAAVTVMSGCLVRGV